MAAVQPATTNVRKQFADSGFEVKDSGTEAFEVAKNNCAQIVARNAAGEWTPLPPPWFIARGLKCELEDHGYQKFWYHNGKRFPIRLNDLRAFHRFIEEVRYVLGFTSLYNEALGSTCARSAYDRLDGRPDH